MPYANIMVRPNCASRLEGAQEISLRLGIIPEIKSQNQFLQSFEEVLYNLIQKFIKNEKFDEEIQNFKKLLINAKENHVKLPKHYCNQIVRVGFEQKYQFKIDFKEGVASGRATKVISYKKKEFLELVESLSIILQDEYVN